MTTNNKRLRRSRQMPPGSRLRRQLRAMARAGTFGLAYTPMHYEGNKATSRTVKLTPYSHDMPPIPDGPRWG